MKNWYLYMNKADIFKWKKRILAFSNIHIFITNSNLYLILKYNLYNIISYLALWGREIRELRNKVEKEKLKLSEMPWIKQWWYYVMTWRAWVTQLWAPEFKSVKVMKFSCWRPSHIIFFLNPRNTAES